MLKVFDAHGPIASDTGLIGETADGRVVVTHLVQHDLIVRADPGTGVFEVEGDFCCRRRNQMTVLKQLILRAWVLAIGRFNANLTRSLVQKVAITGKPKAPYRFARRVEIAGDRVVVTDRFPADMPLRRLSVGSDATSIYVANSNVYQESVLCPWRHADPASLPVEGGWRVWRREYARSRPPGESAGVPEVSIRSGAMEAVS